MVEGVLPWLGGRSWADLGLEEVRGISISVVGEYFFGITVQRLAKKGLRARRGVVTVELGLADHQHVRKHVPMFPHVTQRSVTSAARVSQLLFCSLYRWTLKHGGSDNWIKYEPVYRKISIFAYLGR
ncbi:hypothetical protein LAZ67_10001421 [Cordylochernes scorpioides]|uniref:Uncharacterized protein n=1 Tax=Cordylochernes scorpioides TaxID=51811 RepID=A0ABY6KZL9_9ARAC|nr:hypothetical protein LAZ67_10001421 [Cordylochernes scorpioides]